MLTRSKCCGLWFHYKNGRSTGVWTKLYRFYF
uniref:Uncharacterized protein n=1 Tax=Anguilla anguilla TaxID=7936 RepID=A0A0E9TRA6_ANGAN